MRKKIYIAGALSEEKQKTQLLDFFGDLKKFYEDIGALCENLGFESFIPHLRHDPVKYPDLPSTEVYEHDIGELREADLLIAYVGLPSLGVGTELQFAKQTGIPIILLYEETKYVSRMARGNPVVIKEIIFSDFNDVLTKLYAFLKEWLSNETRK